MPLRLQHLRGVIWIHRWFSSVLFLSVAILGACSSTSALLCYALAVFTTVACLVLATVTIAARCSSNVSSTTTTTYVPHNQYHQRYQHLAPFQRTRREYKDTNYRARLSNNNAPGTAQIKHPRQYLVTNNQRQTLTADEEHLTEASPLFVVQRNEDKRTQVNNSVFRGEEPFLVIVSSDGDGTTVKTWTNKPSSIEENEQEESMRISRERSIFLVLSVATLVLFLAFATVGFVTCILNRRYHHQQQQQQRQSIADNTSPSNQYHQQQYACALAPRCEPDRLITGGGDAVRTRTVAAHWTCAPPNTRTCTCTTAVPNTRANNAVSQMLSVVSAGATAGVVVGGVSPTSQATPSPPPATSTIHHHHHRAMNHHHHHHHRLRSSAAVTSASVVSSSGSSLPTKDPLSAGGTTTAGRHQYGTGYHAPVCLDADIANLPPSIALPDGEDHPYATRLLHLRNYEQESEIYQKCTRPPPNRTVNDSESPPPYRCSSTGVLSNSAPSTANPSSTHHPTPTSYHQPSQQQFPVIRCHSLNSNSNSSCCSLSTATRPTLLSTSSSSGSCCSAADAPGTADFLHRTVKILTGSKRATAPAQGQYAASTSASAVVMVPTNRTAPRKENNSSGSASGSSSPTNRHSRPPV